MGSPLGSALANFLMGSNEQEWVESDHGRLAKFCRRYIDKIFCLFENEHQAEFLWFCKPSTPDFKLHNRK